MVFTVWLDEFCILHAKLQTVSKVLEENLILDTINNIKKFMIPVRSLDIENFKEESNYKYREWYRNDQMRHEENYENGRQHGICRGWYNNGQMCYEHNYENGEKHGINRGWHENGQICYEGNYENGKRHGIHITWYENGQIWYKRNYEHGQNMGYLGNGMQMYYEYNY